MEKRLGDLPGSVRHMSASATVSVIRLDEDGVRASSVDECLLDVFFDGRRIWSFWLHRDGMKASDGYLAKWPTPLRRFLQGTAEVEIRVSEQPVYQQTVTFAGSEEPIRIVNRAGSALALDKYARMVEVFEDRTDAEMEPLLRAMQAALGALNTAGVDAFVAYGTLLGAVREHDFLGHDSDADLGYVSRCTHPVDAMLESYDLQRAMEEAGFQTTRYSGAAFKIVIDEGQGNRRTVDVFGGFMSDERLHLLGEIRTPFKAEWIWPLSTVTIRGWEFAAPARPENLLEVTYGKNWRTPDPAFHFSTPQSTQRRFNAWFRGQSLDRPKWDRFFSNPQHRLLHPDTPFARWVHDQCPFDGCMVDVGSGTGSDAVYWARQGRRVAAFDLVPHAHPEAHEVAVSEDLGILFGHLNLLDARSVGATLASIGNLRARHGRLHFSAHHLFDACARATVAHAMRFFSHALRPGDRLYAQYLTYNARDGYARARRIKEIRPEFVTTRAEESGGRVVQSEEVPVDPEICRADSSRVTRTVLEWKESHA